MTPKFKNRDNLIYCLNSNLPYYDQVIKSYSKKQVLDLIKDLETFQDYMMLVIEKEKFGMKEFFNENLMKDFLENKAQQRLQIISLVSNVWSGIWNFHENILPEKFKKKYD